MGGAFAQRFADIALANGKEVEVLAVEPGMTVEADQVRARLRASGADSVTVCHSESATGALAPVAEIAQAVREVDDVVLVVDGVTSIAGSPVEFDAWGLETPPCL